MAHNNQVVLIPSFPRKRPPGYASVRPSPAKPEGRNGEVVRLALDPRLPRLHGGDDLLLVTH